jgi:hypothetical protein
MSNYIANKVDQILFRQVPPLYMNMKGQINGERMKKYVLMKIPGQLKSSLLRNGREEPESTAHLTKTSVKSEVES